MAATVSTIIAIHRLVFVSLVTIVLSVHGFGYNADVGRLLEAQTGKYLEMRLEIVDPKTKESRLSIDGLNVQLTEKADEQYGRSLMPPGDGFRPEESSGVRSLEIVQAGQIIGISGTKSVAVDAASWEVVCKKGYSGALVCGIRLAENVSRNEAFCLPKGVYFLTFSMWSKEVLQDLRSKKAAAIRVASEAIQQRKDTVAKYKETKNPFQKLALFREAEAAAERYQMSCVKSFNAVPDTDEDESILTVGDGVLMSRKGQFWCRAAPIGNKKVVYGAAQVRIISD